MKYQLINNAATVHSLMGSAVPQSDVGYQLAASAIDAILEDGTDTHEGWSAFDAREFGMHNVDEEIDEQADDEALHAIREAIRLIDAAAAAPKGIVLVNQEDGNVYGLGADTEAAQANVAKVAGAPLEWEHLTCNEVGPYVKAGIYQAFEAPLLQWEAGDAGRVRALGTPAGYCLARDIPAAA